MVVAAMSATGTSATGMSRSCGVAACAHASVRCA
ncbi:hypothetical protein DM46_2882 [Burkholderia mallei]|nr:hypothetical protein DM46_2882 [Burkholderia mallei]